MNDIDWENQPDWAIGIGYSRKHGSWQWFDHGHYMHHKGGVKFPFNTSFCMDDLADIQLTCDKQTKQHDDGRNNEGLPPVGTVCEYATDGSNIWFECEIINTEKPVIYCPHLIDEDDNGLQFVTRKLRFRPIKSDKEMWVGKAFQKLPENEVATFEWNAHAERVIESIYDALMSGELDLPKGLKK